MSKSKKLKLVIFAFVLSLAFVSTVVMAEIKDNAPVPGSADDPIVTLRYVTEVLKPQIQSEILASLSGTDVSEIIGALKGENSSNSGDTTTINSSETYSGNDNFIHSENTVSMSAELELVELKRGQKIQPASGSIEIIARQGTVAAAISPHENLGIGNLSDGSEILNNQTIPINHILLIPRTDGRSIYILSEVAYVFVRGEYEIVD